jgi:hypothetical protein
MSDPYAFFPHSDFSLAGFSLISHEKRYPFLIFSPKYTVEGWVGLGLFPPWEVV